MAELGLQLTLSVSLHAPDSETRSKIMPVNRAWDVEELFRACHRYFQKTGRRISFEYAMIDGVNDHDWQADLIAEKLRGMPGHVNLIPLNDVAESPLKPSRRVAAFQKRLESHGLTATVRRSLGGDIDASCGQLRRKAMQEAKKGKIPMKIWGITDVGLVRKENQDAYAVESRDGFDICVVCDGMGGAAGGKLASEIAVRTYMEALGETLTDGHGPGRCPELRHGGGGLPANRAIREEAARKPEYAAAWARRWCPPSAGRTASWWPTWATAGPTRSRPSGIQPDHQGPLSGGEHGGARRHHRGGGPPPPQPQPHHPGPGPGRAPLSSDGYRTPHGGGGLPAALHGRARQHLDRPGDAL